MATWNPADKAALINLSESNRLATSDITNPGWQGVRAIDGKSAATANHYFEVEVTAIAAGYMVGVATAGAVIAGTHTDPNAWFYHCNTGDAYTNGTPTAYGSTVSVNDIVGVLLKNGKLYFSINGTWQGGADPVAETGAAFTGLTGTLYPILLLDTGTDSGRSRLTSGQFAGTPPTGSGAWSDGGVTGTAAATLVITAIGYGSPAISGTAAAELVITAAGIGGPAIVGYANALMTVTASGVGGVEHVFGVGAASLTITAAGTGLLYSAGVGTAELVITAAGVGGIGVAGTGEAALSITASGVGGHGVSGTGAATLTIYAAGGDWPTGNAAATFSITAAAAGRVGDASSGIWLYLHTTPPAQIYRVDALRGRMNPALPMMRIDFDVSDTAAQLGAQNDSFTVRLDRPSERLRGILSAQAPYGVRVDVMDGGTLSRSGISDGVAADVGGAFSIDCQASGWTDDLPLRTNADLGIFRDVERLPWRYGRGVSGRCVRLGATGKRWLWADHASSRVASVTIAGLPYDGWQWRNETDADGNAITVIETVDAIEDGAEVVAVGDGAMDALSGALMTNPADIVGDLCRRGRKSIDRGDLTAFRAECSARYLEIAGTVESGSLQSALVGIAESIYAAFSRSMPGLMRLRPRSAPTVTIRAADTPAGTASRDRIATRLRVRYAVQDSKPRATMELRAAAIEARHGVVVAEVTLPWVHTARVAEDVGARILGDRARPRYTVPAARQQRRHVPGDVVSASVPSLALSGAALVVASTIADRGSTPTLELASGAAPAITIVATATAYEPEQYTGATVATAGDERRLTITDQTGAAVVGAACLLDGSVTRYTDGAGVVTFPAELMPAGPHTILVTGAGIDPMTLTVTV